MFHGILHRGRINAISAEYQPAIDQRNNECAGLVFLNRYLMAMLAKLEPNHPLLDVGLREKIGRWGGFAYQETEGDRRTRLQAALEAGASFSIPNFDTMAQAKRKMGQQSPQDNRLAELCAQQNLAEKQWQEDRARGIIYQRPEHPMTLYARELRAKQAGESMKAQG